MKNASGERGTRVGPTRYQSIREKTRGFRPPMTSQDGVAIGRHVENGERPPAPAELDGNSARTRRPIDKTSESEDKHEATNHRTNKRENSVQNPVMEEARPPKNSVNPVKLDRIQLH